MLILLWNGECYNDYDGFLFLLYDFLLDLNFRDIIGLRGCNQQKKANAYNVELDEDKIDDEVRYVYNIKTDGEDGPDLIFEDDNESVRSDELDW